MSKEQYNDILTNKVAAKAFAAQVATVQRNDKYAKDLRDSLGIEEGVDSPADGGGPQDRDYINYIVQAGISDSTASQQILNFILGVKILGLWKNMVAWPLRKNQNTNGNTAYSLGGLGSYPSTLTLNDPLTSWTNDGLYILTQNGEQGTSNATVSDFNHFTMGTFYKTVNYRANNGGAGSFLGWGGNGKSTYMSGDGMSGPGLAVDFPEAGSGRLGFYIGDFPDGSAIGLIGTKDNYVSTGYGFGSSSTPNVYTKTTSLSADGTGSPFYILTRKQNSSL
jgi:hypothetical protein